MDLGRSLVRTLISPPRLLPYETSRTNCRPGENEKIISVLAIVTITFRKLFIDDLEEELRQPPAVWYYITSSGPYNKQFWPPHRLLPNTFASNSNG